MIQLLTFPPAFGLFASSPFCVKAAYLLNMSGRAWEREDIIDPRKMPFGKLPAIRVNGTVIADSDRIQDYLMRTDATFDSALSELDRANARAYIRMAEEHLYFHIVLDRWGNDTIWPKVRDTYFGGMPAGLRHLIAGQIRKKTLNGLHQQGLGRLNEAERLERITPDLEALTTRLWHGAFLFGDTPSTADAAVAPMLSAAIASPGDTALKSLIVQNDVLTNYVARVDAACA